MITAQRSRRIRASELCGERQSRVKTERVLLVIDDEEELCDFMQRALRKHFDAIHVAGGSVEALSLLDSQPITHVVCDLFLGEGEPLGHELVRGWRNRKPSIRYLALFTGSILDCRDIVAGPGFEVDGLFKKPSGLRDLLAILKNRAT